MQFPDNEIKCNFQTKKNKYLQKKGKRAVLLNSEYKNTADVWVRKDYILKLMVAQKVAHTYV